MQSKPFGKHLRAPVTTTSCAGARGAGREGQPGSAGGWDGLRSVWVGTRQEQL